MGGWGMGRWPECPLVKAHFSPLGWFQATVLLARAFGSAWHQRLRASAKPGRVARAGGPSQKHDRLKPALAMTFGLPEATLCNRGCGVNLKAVIRLALYPAISVLTGRPYICIDPASPLSSNGGRGSHGRPCPMNELVTHFGQYCLMNAGLCHFSGVSFGFCPMMG